MQSMVSTMTALSQNVEAVVQQKTQEKVDKTATVNQTQ